MPVNSSFSDALAPIPCARYQLMVREYGGAILVDDTVPIHFLFHSAVSQLLLCARCPKERSRQRYDEQ